MSCLPCEIEVSQKHHFADGLYAKEATIPAGYVVGKHKHSYTHLSLLASGRALVTAGDVVKEYTGPACIEIKAGIEHHVEAITDVVWFCIHAVDTADPKNIDEILIHKE